MKLMGILENYNETVDEIKIYYRTQVLLSDDTIDIFCGSCKWIKSTGELVALDGDTYGLNDEVSKYEICTGEDGKPYFVVWYESEWIMG